MNWMDGVVPFIVWGSFTILGWLTVTIVWYGLKAIEEERYHTTFHKWAFIISAVVSAYLVFCMIGGGSIK